MTHDPLCYLYREGGEYNLMADRCSNCKLIAKVRADERRQEEARRMAKFGYWHDYRPELP